MTIMTSTMACAQAFSNSMTCSRSISSRTSGALSKKTAFPMPRVIACCARWWRDQIGLMVNDVLEHTRDQTKGLHTVAEVREAGRTARGILARDGGAGAAIEGLHVRNGSITTPSRFPLPSVRAMSLPGCSPPMRRMGG